jgi:hypothetical protein
MINRFSNLTNIIAALVTIIFGPPTIYNLSQGNLKLVFIFLVVLIICYASIFVYSIKKDSIKFLYYFSYFFTPKRAYVLNLRETIYEFIDRTNMAHTKNYEIKVLVDNFFGFTDTYTWSKEYKCILNSINPKHHVTYQWRDQGKNFFSINFDRHYGKDEIIKTGIEINNLVDENKESELFLSAGIYERTKLLRMIVKFNKELEPKNIKLRIYKNYSDSCPFLEKDLKYDFEKCQILYQDKYPIYDHKYYIIWEFDE